MRRRYVSAMFDRPRAAPLLAILTFGTVLAVPATSPCVKANREALEEILGPAFNPRYMAIDTPPDQEAPTSRLHARNSDGLLNDQGVFSENSGFHVRSDFRQDLPNEQRGRGGRHRRDGVTSEPWSCRSELKWEDLGEDHFPRYLRTVHCSEEECWFKRYRCVGRAFTVKLLRRRQRKGDCKQKRPSADIVEALREEWEFEERAVTFCCDCAND